MVGRGGQHPRRGARDLRSPRRGPGRAGRRPPEPTSGAVPCPNLLLLPARGWRRSRPRGKLLIALIAAALLAARAGQGPARGRERAGERGERARGDRGQPRADPPRADREPAPAPGAAAGRRAGGSGTRREVAADARRRVAAGTLDGPLGPTSCRPVRRSAAQPGRDRVHLPGRAGRARRLRRARDRDRLPLPRPRGDRERPRRLVQGEPAAAASRPGGVRGRGAVEACTG